MDKQGIVAVKTITYIIVSENVKVCFAGTMASFLAGRLREMHVEIFLIYFFLIINCAKTIFVTIKLLGVIKIYQTLREASNKGEFLILKWM